MSDLNNTVWNQAGVAIVTDSVAQVPEELSDKLEIGVVPSIVMMGGKEYRDGIDLNPQFLYQSMRKEQILPKTTAPPVGYFYETFSERIRQGANSVLYIGLTSHLSATFSAAEAAAHMLHEEYAEGRIHLYDTKIATIAQGFIAIEAARMAKKGAALTQVLARAVDVRLRVGLFVSLETLDYLARGGRIGRAAYMFGSKLRILPILTIDKNGKVAPIARVRGEQKMIAKMVDSVVLKVEGYHRLSLAIMHADVPEKADEMEKQILRQLNPDEVIRTDFTPVMGAHTGPGVIGLAYCFD